MYEETFEGSRVLITGGLGFIGSTLAHRLVGLGAGVTVVDSLVPDYGGNLFNLSGVENEVRVNIADVRDQNSINYLVQGQDFLFNLAGTLSHIDSMRDPFTDLEINCVSQLRILEACRHYNPGVRIVFAGTRGQYGRANYLPVDEDHPLHPTDVNGINNIAGESYHLLYSEVHGIAACSLRLTNTFGPRHQMRHPRQGVLNWFIRQILDGEEIRIFGNGQQVRDINFVDDVVDGLLRAMASRDMVSQVCNLGGQACSLVEFVEKLIAIHGRGSYRLVEYPEGLKPIEVGDYVASYEKFHRLTGWRPRLGLEEAIARTLDFYSRYQEHYW